LWVALGETGLGSEIPYLLCTLQQLNRSCAAPAIAGQKAATVLEIGSSRLITNQSARTNDSQSSVISRKIQKASLEGRKRDLQHFPNTGAFVRGHVDFHLIDSQHGKLRAG
jgi:hypothetical protein